MATVNSLSRQGIALPESRPSTRAHLFGPAIDFLCLGGGSLLLIACLSLLRLYANIDVAIVGTSIFVAHFINNPHFANSYQLFYAKFRDKLTSTQYSKELRYRYAFAGIVVPIALGTFMASCILSDSVLMLSQAANIMVLLVGWHYVKQGYGILMVLSALEKKFFDNNQKRLLLMNAYCCWACFWLATNWLVSERNLWGIKHYMIAVPDSLLVASAGIAAVSSLLTLGMIFRKWRHRSVSGNGVVAYLTTLYIWLALLTDPLYAFVVPACHSLQYLVVVWRYRANFEAAQEGARRGSMSLRLGTFIVTGVILGYLGFWMLPELLDGTLSYNNAIFGNSVFLFAFWVFINIHHYMMDNVMWRRGNPETAKYVFGTGLH
jgi:hypothetical protein